MMESAKVQEAGGRAVWFLLAVVACLAGWILHDLLSAEATEVEPTAVVASAPAEPAAAAQAPAPPTVVVISVAQPVEGAVAAGSPDAEQIVLSTSPSPGGEPGVRVAVPGGATAPSTTKPVPTGSGAAPATSVTSVTSVSPQLQIIATHGSIVFVGPNGQLVANTADASSGGSIVLASPDTELSTGAATARQGQAATGAASPWATIVAGTSVASAATTTSLTAGMPDPRLIPQQRFDQVTYDGYEDHSVTVRGNDNIVAYDDSNIFVNHNGAVNANTGDTDSSGINATGVKNSTIRSGASGDADGGDDDGDDDGDDGDDDGDEDDVALASAAGSRAAAAAQAATGRATSGAARSTSLTVGADGFDDISVTVEGRANTVAYDDSNLVIGGSGAVNAQIGDSDTAGIVAMGVENSLIESGCAGDICPAPTP